MKKSNFSIFSCGILCVLGILSSCISQPSIVIKGKVTNAAGKPVIYYRSFEGTYMQSLDTLQLQPDSTFIVTIPAKSPERVDLYLWGARTLGSVYLKPGTTEMDIDASCENPLQLEETPENKVMKKLKALDENVWNLRARKGDIWNIAKDTVASSVYEKLTTYALLLDKELTGVDAGFKSKAMQDIRMQILLAFENQYFGAFYSVSEATMKEWNEVFYKMSDFVDLNQQDNVFSPAFPDAIGNQYGIQVYNINKSGIETKSENERNEIFFDGYKKNLQGKVCESAMANIIWEDYVNERNTTGIPELYDRFVSLYPESALLPLLEKAVTKNKLFNRVAFSDDIHFIESDSLQTLKEITSLFPGKVIFLDIWATWCSPCRKSFAYVEPLQQYAKENDVVLLYITIDQQSDKDKWQKMANYYDLKGEHLIVNKILDQDIRKIFGNNGILAIPRCAIVNTKGDLQFPKASSPEDMDKLIVQLKEAE